MRPPIPGVLLLLALCACHAAPPEIPLHEIPVEPIERSLDAARASFTGMKAVAKVTVERKGRTRVYQSVAVLEQGLRKLRVEAFGPMGESLVAIVWDGQDVVAKRAGEADPVKVGMVGLERIVGVAIAPADLCAVLSGNAPAVPEQGRARAGCDDGGRCVLDLRQGGTGWLIPVVPRAEGVSRDAVAAGADLYRGGRLVLRSRFEPEGWSPAGHVPRRVALEDPENRTRLVVDYEDADAGVAVDDGVFVLAPDEGRDP